MSHSESELSWIDEVNAVRRENARLTHERDELRKTVENLATRCDVAESDYSFLVESYNETTAERDEAQERLRFSDELLRTARRERDEARRVLEEVVRLHQREESPAPRPRGQEISSPPLRALSTGEG